MKGQLRIEQMYAYVVVDQDGTEGVPAFQAGAMAMPMVAADQARLDQLRPVAESMARQLGKPIELVRFTVREQVEVIQP